MLNKLKWIAGIGVFIYIQVISYQRLVPEQSEAFLAANFLGLVGVWLLLTGLDEEKSKI
jgi:hypothetical protein|tara:strand:+ start:230 stop:406 length:177 start_codon:yes stop_codon:yes gene_type:complete